MPMSERQDQRRWIEPRADTRCNGLYPSRAGEIVKPLQSQMKNRE
jgi:hypothetical protein